MLEERVTVALSIDRIGKVAERSLNLLLGIPGPPQDALAFGVRNEALLLHQLRCYALGNHP